MAEEPRRRPEHDPRTEWIADGCSGCITDAAVAVPVAVAAGVIVVTTGLPFWAGAVIAAIVGSAVHSWWTRRRRRV